MKKNEVHLTCKRILEKEMNEISGRIKNKFKNLILDPNELVEISDHTREEISFNDRMKINLRDLHYLGKIKAALWRLKSGSYGECGICGVDIRSLRLIARPTCTKCICCQENEERKKMMRVPKMVAGFVPA